VSLRLHRSSQRHQTSPAQNASGSSNGVTDALNVGVAWRALISGFGDELRAVDERARAVVELDWGLLTFKVKASSPERREAVAALRREYEQRAASTCESCGGHGRVRAGSVMSIRCDDCFNAEG
jgi:hypothetical protein